MHALRRQIEREQFDGDQAIALGIVRAEQRPQGPRADLMKNTKRTERVRGRRPGSFRVQ